METVDLKPFRDEAKRFFEAKLKKGAEEVKATFDSVKAWIHARISKRSGAFKRTFTPSRNPDATTVLAVLAEACFADKSTFHADPRVHAFNDGMRQVWIILQHYTQLTEQELREIYVRKDIE